MNGVRGLNCLIGQLCGVWMWTSQVQVPPPSVTFPPGHSKFAMIFIRKIVYEVVSLKNEVKNLLWKCFGSKKKVLWKAIEWLEDIFHTTTSTTSELTEAWGHWYLLRGRGAEDIFTATTVTCASPPPLTLRSLLTFTSIRWLTEYFFAWARTISMGLTQTVVYKQS